MSEGATNNVKLGLFVVAGLSMLILTLYLIGKSQNLFGSNVEGKVQERERTDERQQCPFFRHPGRDGE